MHMQLVLFLVTIALVVVGAFFYLNRDTCTECLEAKDAYCEKFLDQFRTEGGEYVLSYKNRIEMTVKGCL